MTRERTAELLPVMQGFAEGKEVECCAIPGEHPWEIVPSPEWLDSAHYRLKPTQKLRPWRPEEVPLGKEFRPKQSPHDVRLVFLSCGVGWVTWASRGAIESATPDSLLNGFEVSLDGGKTFGPCGVLEATP